MGTIGRYLRLGSCALVCALAACGCGSGYARVAAVVPPVTPAPTPTPTPDPTPAPTRHQHPRQLPHLRQHLHQPQHPAPTPTPTTPPHPHPRQLPPPIQPGTPTPHHANSHTRSNAGTDSNPHTDSNTNTNTNANAYANTYSHANSNPHTTPLDAFNAALLTCRSTVLNVVILGDSRSIVDTTVAASVTGLTNTFGHKWTDLLAATLTQRCGSHGSGLVPFFFSAGFPAVNADFYKLSGTFSTDAAIGPAQGANLPTSLTLVATSPTTIDFNARTPFDRLKAYCASGPGLHPWTLQIDGIAQQTCGGASTTLSVSVATTAFVSLSTHTASLVCSLAPCEAYGMETLAGNSGVSVHNLSEGSCTAECFGLQPSTQLAFSDRIEGGQQLVIFELITNEPGVGYSVGSFQTALGNLVDHERALTGQPSVLIVSPLQDGIANQAPYYPVLSSTATQYSTAFTDLRAAYGTSLIPAYFGPDTYHESDAGHAAVYNEVVKQLLP